MARGFNLAVIVGNVARDPEVRYTASKQPVAKFAVAVNRKWKGQNGEIHEEVDFIPVSAWGAQAENCEKYLRKGSAVLVEGRIRVSSYEKDGQKRTFTEVVARNVQFLGSPRREEGQDSYGAPSGSFRSGQVASLRESGFGGDAEGDFPMDFAEIDGSGTGGGEEADIPF